MPPPAAAPCLIFHSNAYRHTPHFPDKLGLRPHSLATIPSRTPAAGRAYSHLTFLPREASSSVARRPILARPSPADPSTQALASQTRLAAAPHKQRSPNLSRCLRLCPPLLAASFHWPPPLLSPLLSCSSGSVIATEPSSWLG